MKDLLIVPEKPGPVVFDIYGKTSLEKLRAYQLLLTILFTKNDGYMRDTGYGTPLLSTLIGANRYAGFLLLIGGLSVSLCLPQLSENSRLLILSALVLLQQNGTGINITVKFIDGTSITKELT